MKQTCKIVKRCKVKLTFEDGSPTQEIWLDAGVSFERDEFIIKELIRQGVAVPGPGTGKPIPFSPDDVMQGRE